MNAYSLRRCGLAAALIAVAALSLGYPAWAKDKKRTVLMTEYDDARVGREASKEVAAQIGIIDDPELNAYITGIGQKLLRAIPRRSFQFEFRIVDQMQPNAFALPGGFIYVSRGLLTLVNNEDELACVIGHEIAHVAYRHAAAQQSVGRSRSLTSPWLQAGRMAAYSRDLEHTADKGGQLLCAAAGYDPRGMASFLDALDRNERLLVGFSRHASFFDTHPTSARRSAIARVRASEIRWKRDPKIGDPRASLLRQLDGLPVGQRPEAGMFRGDVFIHPELDFKLRFPRGWRKSNTNSVVGAQAPGDAGVVFLAGGGPEIDPREAAEEWVRRNEGQFGSVRKSGPFSAGRIRAWQLEIDPPGRTPFGGGYVTFIPHNGGTWRITGVGRDGGSLQRTHATARSFRGLSPQDLAAIRVQKLAIVEARSGEDVASLGDRTGNLWSPVDTSAANDLRPGHRFSGGELVKILRQRPYSPKAE